MVAWHAPVRWKDTGDRGDPGRTAEGGKYAESDPDASWNSTPGHAYATDPGQKFKFDCLWISSARVTFSVSPFQIAQQGDQYRREWRCNG